MTDHHLHSTPGDTSQSRLWCDCRVVLGAPWWPTDGSNAWQVWDARGLERARTGVLSPLFKTHAEHRRVGSLDVVSSVGMMLVAVGHTHVRGQRLRVDDTDLWDRAVFLVSLGGPVTGARLLLDHTDT